MFGALYTSASGLSASTSFLDVTANNLSNASTFGYKSGIITFQDLLAQNLVSAPGTPVSQGNFVPTGTQVCRGVRVGALSGNFGQGTITQTGVPLDVAIQGKGFLQVTRATVRSGILAMAN